MLQKSQWKWSCVWPDGICIFEEIPPAKWLFCDSCKFVIYFRNASQRTDKKPREKHGAEKNWNGQVFEEFDKEATPFREKRAEDLSKTIVEAFEKMSDQESIKKYMNYINVFFGDEKVLRKKMIVKEW